MDDSILFHSIFFCWLKTIPIAIERSINFFVYQNVLFRNVGVSLRQQDSREHSS